MKNQGISEEVLKAHLFAIKYGVKLVQVGDSEHRKYFEDDDRPRFVFKMKLMRGRKSYTFTFGQSIVNGDRRPKMYDVLSCLQKWDCGTFENFCYEYGYDTDSRKAESIYKAVCKEYKAVVRLFGDSEECMDELREIC